MIKSIIYKNFQSHLKTVLHFSKGVNVVVGGNDKGKTSLIRGLRFVTHNRPSGDSFRSWWGGDTEVTIKTYEGNGIKRTKGDKKNTYNRNGTLMYKAFGKGVPDDIKSILKLDDINVQQQLEAHYLLSESPGNIAAHFNEIANISIIDDSIKRAKSKERTLKAELNYLGDKVMVARASLEKYKDLDAIEATVTVLNAKQIKCHTIGNNWRQTSKIINRIELIDNEIANYNVELEIEEKVDALLKKTKELRQKEKNIRVLRSLYAQICRNAEHIDTRDKLLICEETVNTVIQKQARVGDLNVKIGTLQGLVTTHKQKTNRMEICARMVVELQEQLPEVCPLCEGTGKLK